MHTTQAPVEKTVPHTSGLLMLLVSILGLIGSVGLIIAGAQASSAAPGIALFLAGVLGLVVFSISWARRRSSCWTRSARQPWSPISWWCSAAARTPSPS